MPREVYPVTALLRVVPASGGDGLPAGAPEYRLELRDPLASRRAELAGRRRPIATDLTTPLAYHFARSPLPVLQEVGLLDPGWLEGLQGLYMLHPYRPGKIPIVFVHGLRSSPLAWHEGHQRDLGRPGPARAVPGLAVHVPDGRAVPQLGRPAAQGPRRSCGRSSTRRTPTPCSTGWS